MHTSLKWAETELRAPSLPPRSGGEGGAAPEGGAPGGGWCNCAQTPPTPDPSPPLASARGGEGSGEARRVAFEMWACASRAGGDQPERINRTPHNKRVLP